MVAYYNDNDPGSAATLRELVNQGLIPYGEVDDRSICDVVPEDLLPFNQVHFFAGIGGWPLALMLAGWNNHDIWSGSCPCQPFSIVGKQKGIKDDRHLWPEMHRLIQARKPVRIVGEQVAGKAGTGWFDIVASDLANDGYAYGGVIMPAKIFGAPHKRERLYWLAHTPGPGLQGRGRYVGTPIAEGWANPHRHNSGGALGTYVRDDWKTELGADQKVRRVPVGFEPFFNGLPAKMGLMYGYGNAIVIPQAQAFCEVVAEVTRSFDY